ncbi:MAG: amidohydrolase [Burkholderiales bacterium]|nr:amidohydrolase [Anaerolineae bacterium]
MAVINKDTEAAPLYLTDFKPTSKLVVPETTVSTPRFPVIDAHNHLSLPGFGGWDKRPVAELLDMLDRANVRVYVDLDGGWGEDILETHLDHFKAAAPDRFRVFGGVDWTKWEELGDKFPEWAADRLRQQAARGAEGLKIWKMLGLTVKDHKGELVAVDDPRLDPIWAVAGELKLPITIHIADPIAFFDPVDSTNERWEELHNHVDWQFPSPPFPSFMTVVNGLANAVSRHPEATWVGAHVGCYSENLEWVSAVFDHCPNFYIDISERIGELGRQPYSARRFFLKYADRILFGTDRPVDEFIYPTYYRFLETDDEYFNYGIEDIPRQGRWRIYGLYLPDDVLEKVYYKNAERVMLGIR